MSLIEQAAQRLEQLRKAGVDIPAATQQEKSPESAVQTTSQDRGAHAEGSRGGSVEDAESIHTPEMAMSRRVDIDLNVLKASGFIRPDAPRSRLSDEFRVIKRPLIDNAMGKGAARIKDGNLIMVTSALPGEGKTFTAANLAISIAMELDNTVMLVDADVARPALLNRMGLAPSKGLLDILVDDSIPLSQVLLRTNIEKLTLLPSGTPHPRATELLASDAMVRLLEDMSRRLAVGDPTGNDAAISLGAATEGLRLAEPVGLDLAAIRAGVDPGLVVAALQALKPGRVRLSCLRRYGDADRRGETGREAADLRPADRLLGRVQGAILRLRLRGERQQDGQGEGPQSHDRAPSVRGQ